MAISSSGKRRFRVPTLAVSGLTLTLLAAAALAVPLLLALYAALTGAVHLATAGQVGGLLTAYTLLAGAAVALAAIGTGAHTTRMVRSRGREGRPAIGAAAALLVVAAAALLVVVLPRASAVQRLNDTLVPFGTAMRDDCKKPLDQVTTDLTKARDDTRASGTDNAAFAAAMQADSTLVQNDAAALKSGAAGLKSVRAPQATYQALLDDCTATVNGEYDFLTNDAGANAIPLPPPFSSLVPKVSGINLLIDAGSVAAGQTPFKVKPGELQGLVGAALDQILGVKDPKLTAEGDQLTRDIQDALDNDLAPFTVTIPLG
jgi:hypothetical protein